MKTCIIEGCVEECLKGRKYCEYHYKERKKKQNRERYLRNGRYTYDCTCIMCGKKFKGGNKHAILCSIECKDKLQRIDSTNTTDNYLFKKKTSINEHRAIVEELLQRKLNYNEIVHHIDGNPKNNSLDNLIILSRSNHGKLHRELSKKKVSVLREIKDLLESTWIEIKKKFTEEWLKENEIQYIIASNIKDMLKS